MITEDSAASQCTQVVARVYFAHQLVRECSAAGSVGLSSPLPALRSRDTILHKVKDHPCYKLGIMLAECPGLLLVWLGGNPKSQYGLMLDNIVNRVCLVARHLFQSANITGQGHTYFLGDLAEMESLNSKRNG